MAIRRCLTCRFIIFLMLNDYSNLHAHNVLYIKIAASLVGERILASVTVMDKLALNLDNPTNLSSWEHLAEEFDVPTENVKECELNPDSRPSKVMFDLLDTQKPNFSLEELKTGLRGMPRNDLVKRVEQCGLPRMFSNITRMYT